MVTVGKGVRVPVALKRAYDSATFNAASAADRVPGGRSVPVCSPATVLVHLAESPTAVANWGLVLDGLGGLVDAADRDTVCAEMVGRTNATLARLA